MFCRPNDPFIIADFCRNLVPRYTRAAEAGPRPSTTAQGLLKSQAENIKNDNQQAAFLVVLVALVAGVALLVVVFL